MKEDSKKPLLLLVDGHSLAFRSFYAFSKGVEGGLSTIDGIPTSVTYGFLKFLLDNCRLLAPKGVMIAFDTPEPTFRHKFDSNYKANRDEAPEIFFQDLKQLEEILSEELNLSICKAPGYEADDVLGTLANHASINGWRVLILSGDRDLFQLVDDQKDIRVFYMGGGGAYAKNKGPVFMDEKGVENKLGVVPGKVVDFKALTGDSSDNIPGVKGIGPKTAINLLSENGDLDGVYSALEELEKDDKGSSNGFIKGALKEKLRNDKDNAYLSRYLAKINICVPNIEKQRLDLGKVDVQGLSEKLNKLELKTLFDQAELFGEIFSKSKATKDLNFKKIKPEELNKNKVKYSNDTYIAHNDFENSYSDVENIQRIEPLIINEIVDLEKLMMKLMKNKYKSSPVAFDTETTNLNPFKAELVGIGVCWGKGIKDLAYIPIGHKPKDLLSEEQFISQLSLEYILNTISPWLTSSEHPKVLQNAKYDRLILLRHGIELNGVVLDTLLADYLIDPTAKHSLDQISKREFGYTPKKFDEVVKKGETFANVGIKDASLYCGMDVYLTRKLSSRLIKKLNNMGPELIDLLENVEQPLEQILAEIEARGIRISLSYLKELSREITEAIINLEEKVYKLINKKINLSSPKQLGEVLFEELGLDRKKSRKTKTSWSTDANVLEKLEGDHPIIPFLIEHRVLSKLLSTYVDALPQLIETDTCRIHTDFNQAVTATGRLSSSNPNLQNIPIRTEFSKRIRKAFLPKENWKLISADYSQIELRILAHLSKEKFLCEAFKAGEDVHELTAKILFDKESIDENERRLGKTINFGVIYGMGVQRFARSTGVSQSEAKEFLSRYKQRYSKVFDFLELQERLALTKGYVKTILGRRRNFYFSPNGLGRLLGKDPYEIDLELARRAGMEAQQLRAAANAPIQGSSADIIKLAMVALNTEINKTGLQAKIILQVHDELVLEVKPSAIEEVKEIVKKRMENALILDVPLLVDIGVGNNWMDVK